MYESTAAYLLDGVQSARRRAYARLPGMWFPMVIFGGAAIVSVAVALRFGVHGHGVYWAICGPLGSVVTAVFYARSARRIGFEIPGRPFLLANLVMLLGAAATGSLGGILDLPMLSVAGPPLAISLGLLIIAKASGSRALAAFAVPLAAFDAALVIGGATPVLAAVALSLAYGVPAVALGVADLRRRPS